LPLLKRRVNLFDASAVLCFLQGESGADVVERELSAGGARSAVNWSEVAQKVMAHGADWSLARTLVLTFGLEIDSVLAVDAELAAKEWRRGSGLSLADRICLATAVRLDAKVWTDDSSWGSSERITQVRWPRLVVPCCSANRLTRCGTECSTREHSHVQGDQHAPSVHGQ